MSHMGGKKRKMPDHELASDNISEILTRASLETVGRCRTVCREWKDITYERKFIDLHPDRTNTVSGFLVQGEDREGHWPTFIPLIGDENSSCLSLDFLPGPVQEFEIVACHCGLLLCKKVNFERWPYTTQFYVCKPSTREWTKIPNPKTRRTTEIIAMVVVRSKPVHYKILRISNPRCQNHTILCCEMFDSATQNWRRLPDIKGRPWPYLFVFCSDNVVVVGGKAFWLDFPEANIYSFDMYDEKLEVFPLVIPNSETDEFASTRLVNHEGKLGLMWLARRVGTFMDLWVMEDWKTRAWRLRKRIEPGDIGCTKDSFKPLAIYGSNVALVAPRNYEYTVCKFPPPSTKVISSRRPIRAPRNRVFTYRSDFEQCNFGDSFEKDNVSAELVGKK